MFFEHWIYSTAIAVLVGMVYFKRTGREYTWIIIASAYIPDLDIIADGVLKKIGITVLVYGHPIRHGDFHNIAALLLFAVSVALLLQIAGIKLIDSFIFAGIGFSAHLFEDALIANHPYRYFWPISAEELGIGIFDYHLNWFGIADKEVLIIGLAAVILSAAIRTAYEGNGWIKRIAVPNISYRNL